MVSVYKAKYVSLHVRETNRAAIGLYRDALGFEAVGTEKGYYCEFFDVLSFCGLCTNKKIPF